MFQCPNLCQRKNLVQKIMFQSLGGGHSSSLGGTLWPGPTHTGPLSTAGTWYQSKTDAPENFLW